MAWVFNPFTGKLDQAGSGGSDGSQVNSDWNASTGVAAILNKPTLFSGAYADLTGKPTIPAAQVQSDWNASTGLAQILNKPTLFSGAYAALTGTPSTFSPSAHASSHASGGGDALTLASSQITGLASVATSGAYSSLTGTPSLATVATSGSYTDLTSKPSLGTSSSKNVAASGNASSTEVVLGGDTRLTDSRTPTAHTHTLSQLTQSAATTGQVASWNGTAWVPSNPTAGNPFNQSLNTSDSVVFTNVGYTSGESTTWSVNSSGVASFLSVSTNSLAVGALISCAGSTVSTLTATQTFTNKTLTAPLISNGTTSAILTSDAANVLAQRNGTSANTLRVYNTYTDASNYERGVFDWTTNPNSLTIGTQKAGTGTARRVRINSAEQIDFYCTDTSRNFQISTSSVTAFNSYNWQWYSGSADPTTSTTPFNNGTSTCAVFKNTTTGIVKLYVNDGGTMKSVALV